MPKLFSIFKQVKQESGHFMLLSCILEARFILLGRFWEDGLLLKLQYTHVYPINLKKELIQFIVYTHVQDTEKVCLWSSVVINIYGSYEPCLAFTVF